MIARVAEATQRPFGKRRITLKVNTREVVQQHLELHPEQILPAPFEKPKQRLLVLHQPIQTAVGWVFSKRRVLT